MWNSLSVFLFIFYIYPINISNAPVSCTNLNILIRSDIKISFIEIYIVNKLIIQKYRSVRRGSPKYISIYKYKYIGRYMYVQKMYALIVNNLTVSLRTS